MEGLLDLWDVDYSIAIQSQSKEKNREEFPTPLWRNSYCIAYPEEGFVAFIDGKQFVRRRFRMRRTKRNLSVTNKSSINYNSTTLATDESSSEMEGVGQIIGGDGIASSFRSRSATQMSILLHGQFQSNQQRQYQPSTSGVQSRVTSSFSTTRLKEFFGGFLSKAKSTTRLERRKGSQMDLMTCSVISTPGKPLEVAESISSNNNIGSNMSATSSLKRTRSLGLIGKRRSRAQLTPSSTLDCGLYSAESHASSIEQLSWIGRSPIPFLSLTGAMYGGRSSTVTSVTPQPQTDTSQSQIYETLPRDEKVAGDTLSSGGSRFQLPFNSGTVAGSMPALPFLVLQLTKHSWIRALDSSLTGGRKYCFAITTNQVSYSYQSPDSFTQRTVALGFRTEQQMKQWLTCFKRMAKPNLENIRHRENSLKITIQEAKNLTPKRKYFCDLCLDRCFHARTTTKVAGPDGVLSWYEEFDLKNLIEISHVTINLYIECSGSKRKKRKKSLHEKAAYLTLSVSELGRSTWGNMLSVPSTQSINGGNSNDSTSLYSSTTTTASDTTAFLLTSNSFPLHSTLFPPPCGDTEHRTIFSITPPALPTYNEPINSGISLRLEGKYESVEVLPLACYAPLKEIVLYHYAQLMPLLQLSSSAKVKYDLGHCLVSIHQRYNSAAEFLAYIIREEVRKQEDVSLLFRENTMATKSIDAYMQLVGDQYLWSVLEPFTQILVKCDAIFESDPTRIRQSSCSSTNDTNISSGHVSGQSTYATSNNTNLSPSEQKQLDKNQWNLKHYTQEIWNSIFEKGSLMPIEMRRVFARLRETLEPLRGSEFCDTLISACVFLRYFTPALYSPSLFGFCDMPTLQENSGRVQRNFTLVAKCIQQLANLSSSFPDKEGYLHFMDEFLRKQAPKMRQYLHSISTGSFPTDSSTLDSKPSHHITSVARTSLDDLTSISSNTSHNPSRVNDFIDLGYELARLHVLLKAHLLETEKEFANGSQSKSSTSGRSTSTSIDNLRDIRERVCKVLEIVDQYLEEGSNSTTTNDSSSQQHGVSSNKRYGTSRSDSNPFSSTSTCADDEKITNLLASSRQHLLSSSSAASNGENVLGTNGSLTSPYEGSQYVRSNERSQSVNYHGNMKGAAPATSSNNVFPGASTISERRQKRFERNPRYATTTVTSASLRSDSKAEEDPWLPRETAARQRQLDMALTNRVGEEWNQLVAMAEKVSPYYTTSLPRQVNSQKPSIVPSSPVGFSRSRVTKEAVNPLMDNPVYEWNVNSSESPSVTPLATDSNFQSHPLSQPALVKPSSAGAAPLVRQISSGTQGPAVRNPTPRLGVSSVIQQRNTVSQMAKQNSGATQYQPRPSVQDQLNPVLLEGSTSGAEGISPGGETMQYEQLLSDLQRELENTRLELSFMSEKLEQAECDKRFLQHLLHHDSPVSSEPQNAPVSGEAVRTQSSLTSSGVTTSATTNFNNVVTKSTVQLSLAPLPAKLSSGSQFQPPRPLSNTNQKMSNQSLQLNMPPSGETSHLNSHSRVGLQVYSSHSGQCRPVPPSLQPVQSHANSTPQMAPPPNRPLQPPQHLPLPGYRQREQIIPSSEAPVNSLNQFYLNRIASQSTGASHHQSKSMASPQIHLVNSSQVPLYHGDQAMTNVSSNEHLSILSKAMDPYSSSLGVRRVSLPSSGLQPPLSSSQSNLDNGYSNNKCRASPHPHGPPPPPSSSLSQIQSSGTMTRCETGERRPVAKALASVSSSATQI